MENMKFRIDSPAQSEALQNVLFSLGYKWDLWSDAKPIHEFLDSPFLWSSDDSSITYANDVGFFERHENKEQNTVEFITRHTKANKMENTTELEFDINADISRQYTRDGWKVLYIHDTGLDITYPISAVVEGSDQPFAYTKAGQYYNGSVEGMSDIVTRPEIKPLIVRFIIATAGITGPTYSYQRHAERDKAEGEAIIKLTYNPNDGSVSAEIVKE